MTAPTFSPECPGTTTPDKSGLQCDVERAAMLERIEQLLAQLRVEQKETERLRKLLAELKTEFGTITANGRRSAFEEAVREVENDDVYDVPAYSRTKLAAAIRALADKEPT